MKKQYEDPEIEIIEAFTEDIVTTLSVVPGGSTGGEKDWGNFF